MQQKRANHSNQIFFLDKFVQHNLNYYNNYKEVLFHYIFTTLQYLFAIIQHYIYYALRYILLRQNFHHFNVTLRIYSILDSTYIGYTNYLCFACFQLYHTDKMDNFQMDSYLHNFQIQLFMQQCPLGLQMLKISQKQIWQIRSKLQYINQHPQFLAAGQAFQVLFPHQYNLIAQLRLMVGSQGAFPVVHDPQLILLIWNNPASQDPFGLKFKALALPPLAVDTIHLQHF